MERRQHPRIQVQWRISFFVGPSSLKEGRTSGAGTASDLSVRGCRVLSDTRVYSGMQMELRLYRPDDLMPMEVHQALVRWSKGREFGLQFLRIAPEEEQRLRHFVSNLKVIPSR